MAVHKFGTRNTLERWVERAKVYWLGSTEVEAQKPVNEDTADKSKLELRQELAYFRQVAEDQSKIAAHHTAEFERLNSDMNRLALFIRERYSSQIQMGNWPHTSSATAVDVALFYLGDPKAQKPEGTR